MTLPKFIITMDGYFRLGMVNQHTIILTLFSTAYSLIGNHMTLAALNGICWKH